MSSMTEIWPDWEMAELIGIGGWSRVYRAVCREHPEIQAAVKMIPAADEEAEQILRGAQRMQQLSGKPGIVRIEDAAILPEEDGQSTVMIRMELLRPLRSYLSDKILSESEVLRMGIELCRGLEACHVQGIVHGDIKPDNIFRDKNGRFMLGDFGEGRLFEKSIRANSVRGTEKYMAPEVHKGGQYDHRADIYSLGIVMYETANYLCIPFMDPKDRPVNRDIYNGNLRKAVLRRTSGEALPPPGNASPEIAEIILKACQYDPEQRFGSADEFLQALKAGKLPERTLAEQKKAEEAELQIKREKQRKVRVIAVIAAILCGIFFAIYQNYRERALAAAQRQTVIEAMAQDGLSDHVLTFKDKTLESVIRSKSGIRPLP